MNKVTQAYLDEVYPAAVIRGARIPRIGDKILGPIWSTSETCRTLGEENIGLFMGGFVSFDQLMDRIWRLNQVTIGGRWIVVPATRRWADAMMANLGNRDGASREIPSRLDGHWRGAGVTVCLIESLGNLTRELEETSERVAGIILCDPDCIVHRSKGFKSNEFYVQHDRPGRIVNFRKSLAIGNWSPPLMVMSLRKAGAVSASSIQHAYYLEAFQFLDGQSVICNVQVNLPDPIRGSDAHRSGSVATGA